MDVYRALWRRRFLILILTAATVGAAYAVVSRESKIYKSTTLVRVQGRVSDLTQVGSALGVAQHLAQTYAHIVTTNAIAKQVYKSLNGRVPRDHVNLAASPVQDLELLYISATSSNPQEAAAVANAAPVALRQFIAAQPVVFQDQIEVVNSAVPSATPVSPRVKSSVMIAFVAGLVFNCGLALLIEFLSDRLPDVDDLESVTGKPVLATVPVLEFRSVSAERVQRHLAYTAAEQPPRSGLGRFSRAESGESRG
jgi:succinoglycan biosynthesis transport protein ExoP